MKTYKTKGTALRSILKTGKIIIEKSKALAIYPSGSESWRFMDGSLATCHKWNDRWIISWIFTH